MSTTFEARFAVISETIRTTGEKLAELSRALAQFKAGDPRAEELQRQYLEIHRRRLEALAAYVELFEEARVIIKAKTEQLEQLRKGEK